ncbi:hypothetical protein [Streptomyces sp. 6N223]|uniref:hypothetical protein n=1 Tax=Streptomyces sp. 6N223 TaxID=3457412 RepID=UPI003FD5EF88
MAKYIDDAAARRALEFAAQHADKASSEVPYRWNGSSWTTPGGEWRDLPLIRRGVGEWLGRLVGDVRDFEDRQVIAEQERRAALMEEVRRLETAFSQPHMDPGARDLLVRQAIEKDEEAKRIVIPDGALDLEILDALKAVSGEILSASDTRATQLLSLASQFDAFRAPMRDPAEWVARLTPGPRSAHVRASVVWEAFSVAEPVLARSLGVRTGKRLLFAAMDRRFGTRRKLAGYEGWRGVALSESVPGE